MEAVARPSGRASQVASKTPSLTVGLLPRFVMYERALCEEAGKGRQRRTRRVAREARGIRGLAPRRGGGRVRRAAARGAAGRAVGGRPRSLPRTRARRPAPATLARQ